MGLQHEARQREALYQHFAAELMREAWDEHAIETAGHRILHHPEVSRDGELSSRLSSLLAERIAEARGRRAAQRAEVSDERTPEFRAFAPDSPAAAVEGPTRGQIVAAVERLRRELDDSIAHFNTSGARAVLERLLDTQRRYPDWVNAAAVERCKLDLASIEKRRDEFTTEIESLATRAIEAAREGRHETAARALKRLTSIHVARPTLLSADRINAIREQIAASGEEFEHRESSRALVMRERAVAEELKHIAAAVHAFHLISREAPHDDPRYADAEREYRKAVQQLRHHDRDWLADLIVELDELMADIHDPTGKAEANVTHFIDSVRHVLRRVVAEIREISAEEASRADVIASPPAGGVPNPD